MTKRSPTGPEINVSAVIKCAPGRVLKAFFDADALGAWWQVSHSVTSPRALGPYVIEWAATDFQDEVLGRLGGVLRGTVMQFDPGRGFFLADVFYLPPDGEPIGPMALEVTVTPFAAPPPAAGGADPAIDGAVEVRVLQTGFEEGARWRRYYEVVGAGLERALKSLKMLLEK